MRAFRYATYNLLRTYVTLSLYGIHITSHSWLATLLSPSGALSYKTLASLAKLE
ncbi:MAG: hypothetical protein IJM43_08865 [Bacteroidaceae bacterium]|nr:hypothetical protein [Bacteroidaceae bacterium]